MLLKQGTVPTGRRLETPEPAYADSAFYPRHGKGAYVFGSWFLKITAAGGAMVAE